MSDLDTLRDILGQMHVGTRHHADLDWLARNGLHVLDAAIHPVSDATPSPEDAIRESALRLATEMHRRRLACDTTGECIGPSYHLADADPLVRALHPVSDATPDLAAALVNIRSLCDMPLDQMRDTYGSEQRLLMAVIPAIVDAALASEPVPATGNPEGIDCACGHVNGEHTVVCTCESAKCNLRFTTGNPEPWKVHNHGPHEGRGTACREYHLNGRLVGACLIVAATGNPEGIDVQALARALHALNPRLYSKNGKGISEWSVRDAGTLAAEYARQREGAG